MVLGLRVRFGTQSDADTFVCIIGGRPRSYGARLGFSWFYLERCSVHDALWVFAFTHSNTVLSVMVNNLTLYTNGRGRCHLLF